MDNPRCCCIYLVVRRFRYQVEVTHLIVDFANGFSTAIHDHQTDALTLVLSRTLCGFGSRCFGSPHGLAVAKTPFKRAASIFWRFPRVFMRRPFRRWPMRTFDLRPVILRIQAIMTGLPPPHRIRRIRITILFFTPLFIFTLIQLQNLTEEFYLSSQLLRKVPSWVELWSCKILPVSGKQ